MSSSQSRLKIAVMNAHLGLQIADLNPAHTGFVDPVRLNASQFSPAQHLKERQRRKQLAIQLAKQSLKAPKKS